MNDTELNIKLTEITQRQQQWHDDNLLKQQQWHDDYLLKQSQWKNDNSLKQSQWKDDYEQREKQWRWQRWVWVVATVVAFLGTSAAFARLFHLIGG